MRETISNIMKWVVKIAGVLVTAPATWLAASTFADFYSSFEADIFGFIVDPLQLFVEIASVTLVEGIFLLAWISLEDENANVGDRAGDVALVWAMYGVIFTIAITQRHAAAVIVRIPIAVVLARQTWGTIIGIVDLFKRRDVADGEDGIAPENAGLPMLVRLNNWWLDVREQMMARRAAFKAFRNLRKRRVSLHQAKMESEINNATLANDFAQKQRKEVLERKFKSSSIGTVDLSTGEKSFSAMEAIEWLAKRGLSRSGAWLRNKAGEGLIGTKEGRQWLFRQGELEALLESESG